MSFLFGGSKNQQTSSSSSSNQAYPQLSGQAQPLISSGNGAASMLNKLLGISPDNGNQTLYNIGSAFGGFSPRGLGGMNDYSDWGWGSGMGGGVPYAGGTDADGMASPTSGPSKQDAANGMQSWLDNSGYSWVRDQGNRGLEGTYASHGAASSGAAAKALTKYNSGLANTYLQQYIGNLQDQQKMGLGAMGTLAGAGQTSSSTGQGTSSQSNGAGQAIGTALAMIAMSDRRAKKNIKYLSTMDNGLAVYSFDYLWGETGNIGVMADEVSDKLPEALGPVIAGFQTVRYNKIPGWEGFVNAL